MLPYSGSVHVTPLDCAAGLPRGLRPFRTPLALVPGFSLPAHASHMRPHISDVSQYRNFHLLSIGYAFRPRLRSRLTQGRSALPWKPWIFGRKDSHLPLATHSGILSSIQSTAPYRCSFFPYSMLPYQCAFRHIPKLRRHVSAPDIFGAGPLD